MTRSEILQQAEKCVCGQRDEDYGSPESNFKIISELWSAYLAKKANMKIITITPHDVAIMMALLKIGRIASGQVKEDNYIDLAGYAACGGEIAGK